ncbi:MAG: glycoside hydrolase, partial [Candidatus Dormibacteraeota bacterium]|nr:glycoside hydrolase [Candidatus Dormibacteraeota bacterium]
HDFYGPSNIWVNVSTDGGQTYGAPIDLMTHFTNPTSSQTLAVQQASLCNTIPTQMKIAKGGPHKGRIYASWIGADPTSAVSGCNITEAEAFHNLLIAWSDDQGNSWNTEVALDAGQFHDASTPFAAFNIDDQGNPYIAFANNTNWDQSCAGPTNPQTPNCEYDTYLTWSPDGGNTWTKAIKVSSDTGTHWFPAIAAGHTGEVNIAWLQTPEVIATDVSGKQHPGACFTPPACTFTGQWNVFAAKSVDLLAAARAGAQPTWTRTQVTSRPMHQGDICNLGIACPPLLSNRNLADFISETVDPSGCAHINFADDLTNNAVMSADQVPGTCVAAASTTTPAASPPGVSPSPVLTPATPDTSGGPPHPVALIALMLALLVAVASALVGHRPHRSKPGPR